jgi:hypothetical protein
MSIDIAKYNALLIDAVTEIGKIPIVMKKYGLDKYRSQALALRTIVRANPYTAYNEMQELMHMYRNNFAIVVDGKYQTERGEIKTKLDEKDRYKIANLDFIKEADLIRLGAEDGILGMMKSAWTELTYEQKKLLMERAYELSKY